MASNAGDGQFLAGKVCKANDAPLGEVFYLRRDHDGTLRQIAPERAEEEAQVEEAVLAWIKAKIKDQAEKGLPSLTVPMLKDFSQEWGSIAGASRARILEVARAAVNNGALLLEPGRNGSGRAVEFLRVESAEPANQPADDLAGSAAPEREPAGEPAKSKPAEPAALSKTSRPVHNILGNHVPHDTAEAEVGKPEGLSGSQTGVASITRVGASGRRGKGTGNATDGEVRSEVRRATQSGLLFLSLNAAFSTGPAGKARLRRESALEILPVNNYLIFPSSFLKLEFIFSSSPIKRLGVFVVSK